MRHSKMPAYDGDRLAEIGDEQMQAGEIEAAIDSFTRAAEVYQRALRAGPRARPAARLRGSKGLVLLKRGDLLARVGQEDEALASYAAARTEIEAALRDEPEPAYLYTNSALILEGRGQIEAGRDQADAALETFAQAVARYNTALEHDPGYLPAYNNRGLVYKYMADLLAARGNDEGALRHLQQAEQEFQAALERDHTYASAYVNLALTHLTMGGLHMSCDRAAAAVASFQAVAEVSARALNLLPEDIETLNYHAVALGGLGNAYAALGETGEAVAAYRAAALAQDALARQAPAYEYALNNQGVALSNLAMLYREAGRVHLALPLLCGALAAFRRSLELVPDDEEVVGLADETQVVIASIGADLAAPAAGAGICVEMLVEEPALWSLLAAGDVERCCLELCAQADAALLPIEQARASVEALYSRLLADWSAVDRGNLISQLAASLEVGSAGVEVMRLFLAAEPDPSMAATAVLGMAHLTPLVDADPPDRRAADKLDEATNELGRPMTDEEMEILAASRPGKLPWK